MPLPYQQFVEHFLTFTLVLVRVSTLVLIAPVFGTSDVPARVRGLLAFALAVLIAPMEWGKLTSPPTTMVDFLIVVGSEAIIGLSLGLGILVLFSGMQVAGQIISQMSGMQLADVFSPGLETNVPIFSHLLFNVALAVFVIIGGHRMVMEALLDTFVSLPLGRGGFSATLTEAMTGILTQSFSLGVRAAAPAMVSLLLATLILGLISRTLPQLNVLAMGFGFSAFTTLLTLSVSLGGAAWLFQEHVQTVLETILEALAGGWHS